MKVWKVVRRHNKKLYSAFTYGRPGVEYKVGEAVRPNIEGTKLFAFRTKEDALNFVLNNRGIQIYEAEAKVACTRYVPANGWWGTVSELKAHWQNHRVPLREALRRSWPMGTVFCDEITLLHKE